MTHAILLVTNFSIMGREKQISLIKKREILTDKIKSRKDKALYSFLPLCFILYGDFLNWLCPWVCNITTSITERKWDCFPQALRKYKWKTSNGPVLIRTQPETRGLKID